jgi:Na+-transporting methylmalonyl-CoA/oxaloacetate decarboxylase gamma subunit
MNVEIYSYSLFTTVLGMLVVFLSLSALSVMMVVLKRFFSGEEKKGSTGRPEKAKTGKAETRKAKTGKVEQPASAQQMPGWVPAAVAAYLAEEQEPDRPSADPWNAVVNHYDPWISGSRFYKRGV